MKRRFPYTSRSPQPRPTKPRYDATEVVMLSTSAVTMFLITCAAVASAR